MKHITLLATAVLLSGLVFAATGCALLRRPVAAKPPVTYALVVSVSGGQSPTEAQWAELQRNFAGLLAARGCALVSEPTLADRIIYVEFTPNLYDPTAGNARVVSVKSNALTLATSPASFAPAGLPPATYTYAMSPGPGYQYFYDSYQFYAPTNSNFTSVPTPSTKPSSPPHHPNRHEDRPPDSPPRTHPPIDFAGHYPVHINPNPGDAHSPPSHRHRPEPSYSHSDHTYSRSSSGDTSSSSSSSSGSSSGSSSSSYTAPASTSSYSAPSYSSPSYSSPGDASGSRGPTQSRQEN